MIISKAFVLKRTILTTWKHIVSIIFVNFIVFNIHELLLKGLFEIPVIIPSILGTALAFFIGFNNNQAYDRWWEARKIWGSLVNDSRSWARQMLSYFPEDKTVVNEFVKRHIAFLYALKKTLREEKVDNYKKYLSEDEIIEVEKETNIANAILNKQNVRLSEVYKSGKINDMEFLGLNNLLVRFSDEMGMSERIKLTVYPTPYVNYTRMFIWVLIVTTTYELSHQIGAWSVFFGSAVGYIFMITHAIGLFILNPFEPIPTGIALDRITRTIEINLLESIKAEEIPDNTPVLDGFYIM